MIGVIGLTLLLVVSAQVGAQDCSAIPLPARQDCGDAKTTPDGCVAKGCCWNVTTVANEPNCFHKIRVDNQCNVDLNARKDCGDVSTTPDSCTAKGCCWMVSSQPGHPNCFYKGSGPGPNPTSGPNPTQGPAPGGKKVYIHMMPWFETKATNGGKWGQHWTMANKNPDQMVNGRRSIASHYYPLIDLYASGDTRVVDWQLGLMKLSGVSGVLIDWPGTAKLWDYPSNLRNCEAIIAGTQRHGLDFAIVYEDHNLGMAHDAGMITDMIAQGKADMTYIQNNYFTKSNYIKINGAPLLLDFGPQTLKGGQWEQIFSVFGQKPVFLTLWNQMQDAGSSAQGEFAWIYSNFIDGLNNFYKYR